VRTPLSRARRIAVSCLCVEDANVDKLTATRDDGRVHMARLGRNTHHGRIPPVAY
jgi:hypothetical protein